MIQYSEAALTRRTSQGPGIFLSGGGGGGGDRGHCSPLNFDNPKIGVSLAV